MAGVVFTVGDHEEHALILAGFFKMIERADNGVKERCAAARIDALERFFQLWNAIGEVLIEVEIKIVVEVDHEGFVLLVAGLNEREGRLVHARPLVAHAAAIVNHQAHADGNILALKGSEFLFHFIFEYPEAISGQTVGKLAAIVKHAGVKHHQADVDLDRRALFSCIGVLPWRKGLRVWNRNLRKARRDEESHHAEKQQQTREGRNSQERKLSGWARNIPTSRRH